MSFSTEWMLRPTKINVNDRVDIVSTEEAGLTLKYFKYNPETNRLEASRTIAAEPNTVEIGNHGLSSGGENIFFKNLTTGVAWFPPWTGVKDQSLSANQDGTGVIPLSTRQYSGVLMEAEPVGGLAGAGAVDYSSTSVIGVNSSIFGQEVVLAEDIGPEDWLSYAVRIGTEEDPVVYAQTITGVTLASGSVLRWWFEHPVEGRAGTAIHSSMRVARGGQDEEKRYIKVRPIDTDPNTRYVKILFRSFEDVGLSAGQVFVNADREINYPATYLVDTTAGQVTLDTSNNNGQGFVVIDARNSFSVANPCVVDFSSEGQGSAILENSGDRFMFYWEGFDWYYINLDSGEGGLV